MKTVYTILSVLLFLGGVVFVCLLAVFVGLNFGTLNENQPRPQGYMQDAAWTAAVSVLVLGSIMYGIVYFARKAR